MNQKKFQYISPYISESYKKQVIDSQFQREKLIRTLLNSKKLPLEGWNENLIEHFLHEISAMDSNNFQKNIGIGEREARIYSSVVAKRNYYLGHGIGRSGDISEEQPKAAGSSLLYKLTNVLALDALAVAGFQVLKRAIVLPFATGMALNLSLQFLGLQKPGARNVLIPRVDQKTHLKAVLALGLQPFVIENTLLGPSEVITNISSLQRQISALGPESILCILSTTSAFCPRLPDHVDRIAALCKENNIFHLINNAFGVQSAPVCKLINRAARIGRVDLIVQSTDKNFLVPVGGTIVASPDAKMIESIAQCYPGRASISPILDLFISLVSLGRKGYEHLLLERMELLAYFQKKIKAEICDKYQEELIAAPENTISFGISLKNFSKSSIIANNSLPTDTDCPDFITMLGSILFIKNVSGTRTMYPGEPKFTKSIGSYKFLSYGCHISDYPFPYLTMACAIGMKKEEIDTFVIRLGLALTNITTKIRLFLKQRCK